MCTRYVNCEDDDKDISILFYSTVFVRLSIFVFVWVIFANEWTLSSFRIDFSSFFFPFFFLEEERDLLIIIYRNIILF